MSTSIRLDGVSKRFRIPLGRPFLAKAVIDRLQGKRPPVREHWALRAVNLEISRGESVGVVGRNGSGKTTLLSLIAGTMYPTAGTVEVKGRIGSLLELGAGFHPDLTGVENIYLNASLLGLTRAEVDERIDSIIEFAEIGDYVHAPLSTYSSGMHARLGFAVIAHIDPEILLIDEVFSVGDATFMEKSEAAVQRFLEKGCTFLLVSHGIDQVMRACRKAVWIDHGEVQAFGPVEEVCERYLESMGQTLEPSPTT